MGKVKKQKTFNYELAHNEKNHVKINQHSIINSIINRFSVGKKIAIDLGTANSHVFLEGKGIVVSEPTVVAYSKTDKKIVAIGLEAKKMLGKSPGDIIVKRPLKQGVIASYKLTEALLKGLIQQALGRFIFVKPEIMVAVPAGLTSVEERAVMEAVNSAGASKIYLIPEPIAAAIGAKLPISSSSGNMIVNMGGGTAEIAVLSMNGIVTCMSKRLAGDAVNDSIISYVKKKHKLVVGEQMAEKVKIRLGSAIKMSEPLSMEIRGSDSTTGLPRSIELDSNDIVEPIRDVMNEIIKSIKEVLESTPPELASDIIDRGIVLSGGTSLIRDIDRLFREALDVPAHVVENPLTSVVEGVAEALDNIDILKRILKT
ncbi:MreB/Mrl family cell shape determining protein [Candidatus Dojkabacteria bacterium]|nr:MreB/Mrl family cell shape determining protein [Candidatus Dojkabacteria bacterium]